MKKHFYPALLVLFVSLAAFVTLTTWKVKEPYEVKFSGGKIHGEFKGLKANIEFDKLHPEQSKISASIEVATVATGFFLKNSHVQDALDGDKYPNISFSSTSVSKNGNGFAAAGPLKMHGVVKPVTIYFTFDDKGAEGVFKGNFKVQTKAFNITHNGSPDELTIDLMVPVSK
jgi:polyisoprenoid-binding protein YceI